MPFPRGQAGRGRKGTAPHSLTYLPVVPTAHLIGKAFAGAEARRGGQVGGRWLCSSLGEKTAARKEGAGQCSQVGVRSQGWWRRRGPGGVGRAGPKVDHCQNSLPRPSSAQPGREVGRGPVTRRPFVLPAFCSRNSPFLTGSLLLPGLIGIPSHPQGPRPGWLGTEGGVGQPHTGHPECQQTLASTSDPGPVPAWERSARDQKSEIRWSLAFPESFPCC